MNSLFSKIIFICCLVFVQAQAVAQSTVRISSVNVHGNKKTKTYIVLREMQFHAGDTLKVNKLPGEFVQARNQIYNTNLFTEVKIDSAKLSDSSLQVNVFVKEKWYVYPTPQFQLVDRNFNDWIKTYHASLERVVYGVKFAHYNFSGRHDPLRIYLLNGYARNISFSYNNPYINPALTRGLNLGAGFTQNREVSYRTTYYNKLLNYRKEGFVRNNFNAVAGISNRKGFFKRTSLDVYFNYINADDSLLTSKYNPLYFNSSHHTQVFPDINLSVSYVNTDNNNYPLRGLAYGYGISKRGLRFTGGINSTLLQGTALRFISHGHNWYSSIQASGIIRFPFRQAYINDRAIGYGNLTLRGLEYYVVDGVAAAVTKYTLSKKIAAFKIKLPFKIRTVPYLPFQLFAKTYADAGYCYIPKEQDTRLNNRFLYTGGIGLDIVALYDIVIKVEYSFNQLGEKGLFLHGKAGF